jgi:hypothetical protein
MKLCSQVIISPQLQFVRPLTDGRMTSSAEDGIDSHGQAHSLLTLKCKEHLQIYCSHSQLKMINVKLNKAR